jgi:hypothetical protein
VPMNENAIDHTQEPRANRVQALTTQVDAVVSAKIGALGWMIVPPTMGRSGYRVRSDLRSASIVPPVVQTWFDSEFPAAPLHNPGEKTAILGCVKRLA